MIPTTIISSSVLYTDNQVIMMEYACPGIGTSTNSGDVLALELLGVGTDRETYRHVPNVTLNGGAYAIRPVMIGASSTSTDLDLSFMTTDTTSGDIGIRNPYSLNTVNLVKFDHDLGTLILRNQMDPVVNYIYVWLQNNDGTNATGTVYVSLMYINLLDREPY